MSKFLSTKAKRKAMADFVSQTVRDVWEQEFALKPCDLHPDEWSIRLEDVETDRGQVSHICVDVSPRGVSVHIKFSEAHLSPAGYAHSSNSRKWNHYIWPHGETDVREYRQHVESELWRIMEEVRPNGLTRQNLPDLSGYWEIQRAEFAARSKGVAA